MPSHISQQAQFLFSPTIQAALQELCASDGVVLIEALVRGSNERRIVEVYVDKPEGISLDECGSLSERIGELFDAEKIFPAAYRLEVSSPGVSRPLQFAWQFSRNIGRLLSFEMKSGEAIKGRISGVLSDIEHGDVIVVDAPKKAAASGSVAIFPMEIAIKNITNAVIEIEF
jgi:ribosome maturation factor RimP